MKQIWIAVALAALAVAGCSKEQEVIPPVPQTSATPDAKGVGGEGMAAQTPPGAASDAYGNKAAENTMDNLSTQKQLDPMASGSPSDPTTGPSARP